MAVWQQVLVYAAVGYALAQLHNIAADLDTIAKILVRREQRGHSN